MDILYLVIPCYNEEAVLDETKKRLEIKISSNNGKENIK